MLSNRRKFVSAFSSFWLMIPMWSLSLPTLQSEDLTKEQLTSPTILQLTNFPQSEQKIQNNPSKMSQTIRLRFNNSTHRNNSQSSVKFITKQSNINSVATTSKTNIQWRQRIQFPIKTKLSRCLTWLHSPRSYKTWPMPILDYITTLQCFNTILHTATNSTDPTSFLW